MKDKLLEEAARNLREDAQEAHRDGNEKLAVKLIEGARRLERWSREGTPAEYSR